MSFELKPHTIYVMIGPSNCGKSTFVNQAISYARDRGISATKVSSDDCRRELLCDMNLDKMNPRMMTVSHQAFLLLKNRVDLATQWPVNNEVVFVDSTGLDSKFQNEIANIAKKNNYNIEAIVFDFNNKDEYYLPGQCEKQDFVTRKHVKRLREETLRGLNRTFNLVTRIRRRNMGPEKFSISDDFNTLWGCNLGEGKYTMFSDSHGCYDSFIEGYEKLKETGGQFINMGDYIDKGPQVREMIEFLYENPRIINLVGNHENYVFKRLEGKIKESEADEYFDSLDLFMSDSELANKFKVIFRTSLPFVNLNNKYILTHAPCFKNQLGKLGLANERSQRNWRYTGIDSKEKVLEGVLELMKDRPSCGPKHIFGHISFDRVLRGRSFMAIDTGVVDGNELTFLTVEV